MANRIGDPNTASELIRDFSGQRYGLYYLKPKDPKLELRPENMPDSKFAEILREHHWLDISLAAFALICFYVAIGLSTLFLSPETKPTKEIKISSLGPNASIKAAGKLEVDS